MQQLGAQAFFNTDIFHGQHHAGYPLVTLLGADGERHVAGPQARVAEFFNKKIRATEPAGKEHVELVTRDLEVFRVHGAQFLELGYGIHQFIKAVAKLADTGVAADFFIGGCGFFHRALPTLYLIWSFFAAVPVACCRAAGRLGGRGPALTGRR